MIRALHSGCASTAKASTTDRSRKTCAPCGPGIEFLEYLIPRAGRPVPIDAQPSDVAHWQTVILVESATTATPSAIDMSRLPFPGRRAARMRDPDGHVLQIYEP